KPFIEAATDVSYPSIGDCIVPIGMRKPAINKTPSNTKRIGAKIFPILSTIFAGNKENNKTTPKNITEKISSAIPSLSLETKGSILTSNATVVGLGDAKKDPIVI